MNDINVVKERVIEELKKQGIDVYFIDFYVDDGKPYFVYTFDESMIGEATEYYKKNNQIVEGAFDDWSFFEADDLDDWLVADICDTIKTRRQKTRIRKVKTEKNLIDALRKLAVHTGSLICLGCGYEHNCDIHGCAIVRAAREQLEKLTASPWISVNDRLPKDDARVDDGDKVLVIVSGRPKKNVRCVDACEIAEYYYEDGWYFDAYPEWEDPQVTYWMPLPERPEDCHD